MVEVQASGCGSVSMSLYLLLCTYCLRCAAHGQSGSAERPNLRRQQTFGMFACMIMPLHDGSAMVGYTYAWNTSIRDVERKMILTI